MRRNLSQLVARPLRVQRSGTSNSGHNSFCGLFHCGESSNAMLSLQTVLNKLAAVTALGVLCLTLQPDVASLGVVGTSTRMMRLPHRTLWAWERTEDLRAINPKTTAIAWLDQTILLGANVTSQPRRQPLRYPAQTSRIAVVRIETFPTARLDSAAERQTVDLLLRSVNLPKIAALQVDFDATQSQRSFYRKLLLDLRQRMPAALPLSITALASWCSNDDWIGSLPVDEAVPMFFRMEPDRRRAPAGAPEFRIREPKCMGSVGISTREAWPDNLAGKRIYVFADRGWREDLSLLADRKLP